MHFIPLILLAVVAWPICAQVASEAREPARRIIRPGFDAVALHAVEIRPGVSRFVVIGADGLVRELRRGADGAIAFIGTLTLASPRECIYDFAEVLGDGGSVELVSMSSEGLLAHRYTDELGFGGEPVRLDGLRRRGRAVLDVRTGTPKFTEIGRDIDGDGVLELIVPRAHGCDLWMRDRSEGASSLFARRTGLDTPSRNDTRSEGRDLSEDWEFAFAQSALRLQDVNGDGRQDLVSIERMKRSFYLQDEAGRFPDAPSATLDASLFRDPTPSSGLRPGRVLAGNDRPVVQSGDIDADGLPDTVIAHRRTIWVFRGTPAGPRFDQPSQILKSSEDITLLLLLDLDDDAAKDLVAVRVEVPSLGAIVVGALSGLEVAISAVGYRASKDGTFERAPTWRSRLVVQLPSLSKLLADPESILRRFEAVGEKIDGAEEGDLDGDGRVDLAQVIDSERVVAIWRGVEPASRGAAELVLRELLFGQNERTWTLDDLVAWLGRLVEGEIAARTRGRAPDLQLALRPASEALVQGWQIADLDGDGRSELVVVWTVPGPERLEFELFEFPAR